MEMDTWVNLAMPFISQGTPVSQRFCDSLIVSKKWMVIVPPHGTVMSAEQMKMLLSGIQKLQSYVFVAIKKRIQNAESMALPCFSSPSYQRGYSLFQKQEPSEEQILLKEKLWSPAFSFSTLDTKQKGVGFTSYIFYHLTQVWIYPIPSGPYLHLERRGFVTFIKYSHKIWSCSVLCIQSALNQCMMN